jgi:hypothetical protein
MYAKQKYILLKTKMLTETPNEEPFFNPTEKFIVEGNHRMRKMSINELAALLIILSCSLIHPTLLKF